MTKRRQDDDVSLPVLLIGILFVAAVLFFNWRMKNQEAVILDIKAKGEASEQRIKKLEDETVVIEVGAAEPEQIRPQRVKIKPKRAKANQSYAGDDAPIKDSSNFPRMRDKED